VEFTFIDWRGEEYMLCGCVKETGGIASDSSDTPGS
jgi:hypothetical protein